jgi:hypothetical protein
VGRGEKLEENRENATERLQVEKPMGKKRKEKGKSYRGNNNKDEIGDQRKKSRKGRRRRTERNVHIGNEWWKILTVYSKGMRTTTRRVENTMKKDREGISTVE